jgi:hypothetical protein
VEPQAPASQAPPRTQGRPLPLGLLVRILDRAEDRIVKIGRDALAALDS